MKSLFYASALGLALLTLASPTLAATVTFDNGVEGWRGPGGIGGNTFVDPSFGNPDPSFRTQFNNFGITFYNNTNLDFIGDYTATPQVDIAIDVYTTQLDFLGSPTPRELIVELRDYDNAPPNGFPYTSVWHSLGVLNQDDPGWHSWGVTIEDTSATELPSGWGGYGAEDPDTFEPILPEGRTFANVLAEVDEIAFTTLVPGFDFSFSDYDVAIDNISVARVPEPGSLSLLSIALGGLLLWRRR